MRTDAGRSVENRMALAQINIRTKEEEDSGASLSGHERDHLFLSRGGVEFTDIAGISGLDDPADGRAFGLIDYDRDGWLDLFVVNSYAQTDIATWEDKGGLPRSALFRNRGGTFEDVSRRAGADLPLRGNGCVAADLNGDGHTDLFVTTAGYNVPTDTYDALLWNDGDGSFTEGA